MKVLVQWAAKNPQEWVEVDSSLWATLPKLPVPARGQTGGQNDMPGYIMDINVQGVCFAGSDHYAVESNGSVVRVTVWNDDPDDYPPGERFASVWEFLPLAPDDRFGGAYNTRQRRTLYAELGASLGVPWGTEIENTVWKQWEEFIPPPEAITRHGIWLPRDLFERHLKERGQRGWREWTEGVPAEEVENGKLREQARLGRKPQRP